MTKFSVKSGMTAVCFCTAVMLVVAGESCSKKNNGPHPVTFNTPSNFPAPVYDISNNPLTEEGIELGRQLFYDPLLSRNNTISCANCHLQANAFTHHGHDVSHGIDDKLGTRNSPAIMNLAWNRFFFWDGGVFDLDLQPIAPIENPVEMDEHVPNIVGKLKASSKYRKLFADAFGNEDISSAKMLQALSQFMVQCVSADSRYDKYKRNEGVQLTGDEAAGLTLFQQKCASCHSSDLFTDNQFHNNGLSPSMVNDSGRFRVTLNPADKYLFKTPSLRNIALTAPYMHDGRFYTLQAVLDHYSSGVQDMPTLDPKLKNGNTVGIPLSQTQKDQLIAFLKTLSDDAFIHNPKLSQP